MPSPLLPPQTPSGWQVLLLVLVSVVPVLLATRPCLARLPEPASPHEAKTAYADLPTHGFVAACTALAAGAATLTGLTLPAAAWPLWWVLCAPALVLVAVDARTTWLPLPLTRAVQTATVGAALVSVGLGGWTLGARALGGAVAAGLLYLMLWRFSGRTLGFGDVRLAPVLGAAAAAVGWSTLLATLLLGSLVGAVVGVVLLARRRPGAFAYAPSMLLGAFLAAALVRVSG